MPINRLMFSETLRKLGPPGIVGIALLAFSLSLALTTLLPSWLELDQLRLNAAAAQQKQRVAAQRGAFPDDSPAARLRAFYAFFPVLSDTPESLSRIYAAAAEHKLQLLRGEYALSTDRQTGLMLYRITLPVRGGYTQIREFVATARKALPSLALDELSFERPSISDNQVQARIRLTLYLKYSS